MTWSIGKPALDQRVGVVVSMDVGCCVAMCMGIEARMTDLGGLLSCEC